MTRVIPDLIIPISHRSGQIRTLKLNFDNAEYPLTETEWQQFHKILDVMKPGLVEPPYEWRGWRFPNA